jgi:hypothetical protein
MPGKPETIPKPLFNLIYPNEVYDYDDESRDVDSGFDNAKLSVQERVREQMRRDMLSDIGEEVNIGKVKEEKANDQYEGIDWQEHVVGTKKVLGMSVS